MVDSKTEIVIDELDAFDELFAKSERDLIKGEQEARIETEKGISFDEWEFRDRRKMMDECRAKLGLQPFYETTFRWQTFEKDLELYLSECARRREINFIEGENS